ncbi:uncharacterized protein LOC142339342 isoform X2 [Convolutriloba macropyga]|uniref:uncharacterized protein LOC142339342 isoform X2 n=1 Tax=Convolutriloba macropyga TaxID=536237 RepID=UPI003F5223A2
MRFSVLKLPGRVVRVKTPMCPIVKRFTKNRDVYAFVQLPQNVTFEFTPKNGHELNLMNDARLQNPFIRLTVPISKSFKSVLQFIEDRTKYRCFQNFRQLSEQCRPYVNEPSIVCSLHPYLMSNICSVEETDKVYTPPSFNGAEQMLAQGIGLEQSSASQISNFVDNLTSSSATTIERGESLEFESKIESNCDRPADNCCSPKDRTNFNIIDTVLHSNVKTNESNQSPPGLLSQNNLYLSSSQPPQSVYNSQQCVNPKSNTASHLISPPSSKGPTFQQNGNTPVSSRASEASNRPQLIYVVTAKNAPTKQYIRSATSNDSFICKLKSGFTSESVTEDLTIAGLLVMLNVCPIIQMEYSLHMETKFGAEEIGVSKELESIINLGMQISKSKRSQTPVNGNSKSPVQQSQPLTVAQQPATCNVDSNIPSTNVNPAPGSMAERQLKDHIMMLQSSGKVRLRNRLRHGQETSLGSQMISGSESSFRPITTQQQSVFCAKPLPQIAPKLFNQITGSIAVNGHGNLQKVTLGNHNNGQRVVSVNTSNLRRSFGNNLAVVQTEKQSCAQTITVTSPINFLEQNANDGQLQPGQTYMQTQQVLASSDDSSIKDIVEIALNCANAEASPKSSKECQSLNLDPLLCSTQLCSNEVDPRPPDSSTGESEVRNHDVTTGMLPPVHEILGGTGRSDNSKQHPLVSTKVSRVPEVPEINDGELSRGVARQPVPQVRFLPGYSNQMTENFVDTASNDSFLSKQLDGEIAEMLNENSIDVVNKLDALLNPTGSSGEAAIY